jgi:hypothetical protein
LRRKRACPLYPQDLDFLGFGDDDPKEMGSKDHLARWAPRSAVCPWGTASSIRTDLICGRDSQVKLTVTHDDFVEGSKVFDAISKGWPLVLSSLKSYLEANRVLYAPGYDKEPAAAS